MTSANMASAGLSANILQARGLQKRFRGIHVLRGVDISVPRGRITALIGSNGAGKSTVLNLISGFIEHEDGMIEFEGRRIETLPPYRRARMGISRSFQHPRAFTSMTVLDNVLVAATPVSQERLYRNLLPFALRRNVTADTRSRAIAAIETCRLTHRANDAVGDLGYGEQKLVMLAQLLATGCSLLCLDELCAGLENAMIGEVAKTLRDLANGGMTILFIEHNLELVRAIASDVVFLHQGLVVSAGAAECVLEEPELNRLYLGL